MTKSLSLFSPIVISDIESVSSEAIIQLSKLKGSNILITGIGGFIASSVALYIAYLSSKYSLDITIQGICRSPKNAAERFAGFPASVTNVIKFIQHDIKDPIIDVYPADIIFHAASHARPSLFSEDPIGTFIPNSVGTIYTLEHARKSKITNYIYTSTSGVYGFNQPNRYPLSETDFGSLDSAKPENIYLESKRIGETLVSACSTLWRIPYTIIRPSITYGPGISLSDERSYAYFCRCAVLGEDIMLQTRGEAFRNYLYIRDAVDAIIRLMPHALNKAYNLAHSTDTRVCDLAMTVADLAKKEINIHYGNHLSGIRSINRVEFSRTSTNQALLYNDTGWVETVGVRSGFERTLVHLDYLKVHTQYHFGQ